MESGQNKNCGKESKKTDGYFASKKIKHDPQDESARAQWGAGMPPTDGERHTGKTK